MSEKQLITECSAALVAVLQSIASVRGKVLEIYSEDDLMDKTKQVAKPCAGIVYEGMRAIPEGDKSTHKVGISAEANFSIILLFDTKKLLGVDSKLTAIKLLDEIRPQVRKSRSPTGHYWRFIQEAPVGEKHGTILWIQRWATPIQTV